MRGGRGPKEDGVMEWWRTATVIVLAVALVAVIATIAVRSLRPQDRDVDPSGTEDATETEAAGDGDSEPEDASLFGDDVPVRRTEERLVQVMPDALIVADADGHVTYESPAAAGLPLTEHGRVVSDDLSDILTQVDADGRTRERELALPRDPDDRPAASGRGVTAGDPSPSDMWHLKVRVGDIGNGLLAAFLRDVGEQRRFEAMRRDFVTNVSHELKTPAGAISLLAETVGDAADDPDAVRYFAGRITKESERLTELVHRLIDLQKAQGAGDSVELVPVGLLDVARRAIADNQVQAEASHIDLQLSVDGTDLPTVAPVAAPGIAAPDEPDAVAMGDGESLVTAVKNLVENAIHYSPAHTTVRIALAHSPARDGKDATVTLRVIDQGIGIPRESLGRIFERFYRVDPARSRETGGTGLGLAIAKHCVEDCGGTISVWSHEHEGSTFTIELPAASEGTTGEKGRA